MVTSEPLSARAARSSRQGFAGPGRRRSSNGPHPILVPAPRITLGEDAMRIGVFFAAHWAGSVIVQSLFQHRYAAHRMYTMGRRTERAVHLLTAVVQGSSYLEP